MRLELVIRKLGGNRPAKGALEFCLLGPVLSVVLLEAAQAHEVGALAAGQDVVEGQRANGAAVDLGLACHLRAQLAHLLHLALAVLGHQPRLFLLGFRLFLAGLSLRGFWVLLVGLAAAAQELQADVHI